MHAWINPYIENIQQMKSSPDEAETLQILGNTIAFKKIKEVQQKIRKTINSLHMKDKSSLSVCINKI